MSQIQKILRMNHPGVMRDFSWASDLPEFGKYNLIYGWNGSGKTTLSRFLRDLETRQVPSTGEISVRIGDVSIEGTDFPTAQTQIRVFNRDFVDDNVFPVSEKDVPPIFVVGEASVGKQREVERLKSKKAQKIDDLATARKASGRAATALDQHCIAHASVVKNSLRVSGSGAFNDYNKTMYRKAATEMLAKSTAVSHQLDETSRERLRLQHQATNKRDVGEVSYKIPDLPRLKADVSDVLEKTVVSSTVAALEKDPKLGNWSREGLALHRELQSKSCLFCQQLIPEKRLEELEAHFNEQYERFLADVEQLRKQFEGIQKETDTAAAQIPNRSELFEDLALSYDPAEKNFSESLRSIKKVAGDFIELLDRKKDHPFKRLKMELVIPLIDAAALDELNQTLRQHNETCGDFESRKVKARERLALDLIAASSGDFENLTKTASIKEAEARGIDEEVTCIDGKIEEIERDIVLHRQPAEELNADLFNYLGHREIQLEIKDTGYAIVRNDEQATSLSEGEKTALAVLYFLKSLQDQSFDAGNGIVVIDDPVSSLDANALYMAFGYIRQRLEDVGQVILLTHNFTFFRQVQNWFKYPRSRDKRLYMLEQVSDIGPRRSTFSTLDPLLEIYASEYHYLFSLVHRTANTANSGNLERYYGLPNIARRLLENFLAFRQPQNAGELWKSLKHTDIDEAKRSRIIRFVHEYSHSIEIGATDRDLSLLSEAQPVLRDIMDFIRSQDAGHYDAMIELVGSDD